MSWSREAVEALVLISVFMVDSPIDGQVQTKGLKEMYQTD